MAFADTLDLASGQDQDTRHRHALERATDLIRAATAQHITQVVDDVVTLRLAGRRLVQLPEIPVTAIKTVTLSAGSFYQMTPVLGVDYTAALPDGILACLGYDWPAGADLTVTYTHGYEQVPGDLVRLCADLAGRIVDGTLRLRSVSETVGQKATAIAYQAGTDGDGIFDLADQRILDGYRLPPLP